MTSNSGMFHQLGGDMNSSYVRNTFTAISAEAGLDSKDVPTAFSATAALFNIFNQSVSAGGGDNNVVIVPRMLNLISHQVNTNATDFRLHFYRDTSDRYSTGGTELTPVVTSFDDSSGYANYTVSAEIFAGELTLESAGSDVEVLWRAFCKDEIFAVNEGFTIVWGALPSGSIDAAALTSNIICVPPMPIGRGQNLSIHEVVAGAQSADAKLQFQFWFEEHGHNRV